ncbi:Pectate lyase [Chryseobacterium taichungense]|uniref:Pectate lyase n=2 Tax=Chryseobacterium taichungense TaxID=295069 RepID=A0A1H7YJN1_9FLAO|nr:Pectate lyase [Chryseobacterium taichungense]
MFWKISLSFILCSFNLMINAQQLAFPGAEGFGRYASGGRGGTVYYVTNLNDTGAGSFRDAVSKSGRTVVFDVAGVIKINEKISAAPGITIAGQTAPGTGVTVYGNSVSFSGNTIVRYMRFRGSIDMPKGACTVVADDLKDIIFDHVSIEWGRWDNLHVKNSSNITFQYCLIGEGIDPQRFGALLENPVDITVHHCLWTGNQSRNPKAKAKIEYINNVVYNWGKSAFVGGHSATDHYQDIVGNYFIAGPSSTGDFLSMFTATDHVYHRDNYVDLDKDGKVNGRLVTDEDFIRQKATLVKVPSVISRSNVKISAATDMWKVIMNEAGSSLKRDAVDQRIIGYFKSLGYKGQIFKTEADAGGQPKVKKQISKLKDTDADGIPNKWETKNNLNGKDSGDAAIISKTGYSNLENYINSLVK